ncbi:hypothetical protein CDAR_508631 [Caerostris darwini]|uniref:Uncharacterized protein n=1 Tax=Caerostris darwini TaxID=1538125 RepID=A0AAV4N1K3_9ARAC|nr:hypothetical protein CDAR_508631 [Caerostris darwini]
MSSLIQICTPLPAKHYLHFEFINAPLLSFRISPRLGVLADVFHKKSKMIGCHGKGVALVDQEPACSSSLSRPFLMARARIGKEFMEGFASRGDGSGKREAQDGFSRKAIDYCQGNPALGTRPTTVMADLLPFLQFGT